MTPKNILLVEDDYLNRRLTKKVLTENGYDVFEAKNAVLGLEVLKNNNIDLVILDVNLGENEMDGIDLGKLIQLNFKIPLIYISAYENKHFLSRAKELSHVAYLTKPFKNSDLIEVVHLALH